MSSEDTAVEPAPRPLWRRIMRWWLRISLLFTLVSAAVACVGYLIIIQMPGSSFSGTLPTLDSQQRAVRDGLMADVEALAGRIGQRNVRLPHRLHMAVQYIEGRFVDMGYTVDRHTFRVGNESCHNLIVERRGARWPDEVIVVGAHYDTVVGCDGANDNGSGVAALLALAEMFVTLDVGHTLRFVAFVNEEPPYFQTDEMGSLAYARHCRDQGETLIAMISLETMGYYSTAPDSQQYPYPFSAFYPSTGNFVAIVGDIGSRGLVHQVIESFRRHVDFPSEGVAAPGAMPGIGWSDHWSFWQVGCPAVMITDTAPFRYPHYHSATDTVEQLDYDSFARVVHGLRPVLVDIAGQVAR